VRARERRSAIVRTGSFPLNVLATGIEPRSAVTDPARLEAEKTLADAQADAAWPELTWWKRFGDPQLDRLIEEGLAGSPNIRLAQARLDQAKAAALIAHAPLSPQVGASGDLTRQRFSENYIFPPPIGGATFTTTQLALSAGYDVDFWGKNRSAYEAALGRSRAAQAETYAARLVLASAVAAVYVQLERSYEQLDIARRTLEDLTKAYPQSEAAQAGRERLSRLR
jgi:outer membrane protein TolC